tara:strand:+ start:125 stop:301 length:177 start_codon:yes stop_codon:yes gene_type:complete
MYNKANRVIGFLIGVTVFQLLLSVLDSFTDFLTLNTTSRVLIAVVLQIIYTSVKKPKG